MKQDCQYIFLSKQESNKNGYSPFNNTQELSKTTVSRKELISKSEFWHQKAQDQEFQANLALLCPGILFSDVFFFLSLPPLFILQLQPSCLIPLAYPLLLLTLLSSSSLLLQPYSPHIIVSLPIHVKVGLGCDKRITWLDLTVPEILFVNQ